MDLQTLFEYEKRERWERMVKVSSGCYVIFYLLLGIFCFVHILLGFPYERESRAVYFMSIGCTLQGYELLLTYLSDIREFGKRVNIFEKYIYTPIDFNLLRKAKLKVVCDVIWKPVCINQLLVLVVRILCVIYGHAKFFDVLICMPILSGIAYFLMKDIQYRVMSKKAMDNR